MNLVVKRPITNMYISYKDSFFIRTFDGYDYFYSVIKEQNIERGMTILVLDDEEDIKWI